MSNCNRSPLSYLLFKKRNNRTIRTKYISKTYCCIFCFAYFVFSLNHHFTKSFLFCALLMAGGCASTHSAEQTPENATDKSVTWMSDNTNVAVVDDKGVVKAVSEGVANILVTAANGWSDACVVTVKKDLSLKEIAFVNDKLEVKLGIPVQLELVFTPENAENKEVTWKSSNTAVAKVSSDGMLEGLKEGQARLTATSKDGGLTATCDVNVTSIMKAGVYWRDQHSLCFNGESLDIYAPFGISIDPSNNIYYFDTGKIYWNGAPLMDFRMSISKWVTAAGGGFYFIPERDDLRRSLSVWKLDPAKGETTQIKLFDGGRNNYYWVNDATADSNGNLYLSGYSFRSPSGFAASLWKLDKNNKATLTLLTNGSTGEYESCDAVAVNKNGDVFCLVWDGTYTGSYYNIYLYKNGKKVRRVSSKCERQFTQSCDLTVLGDDVYAIVCENADKSNINRIKVYKNDKVLYTLKEGERVFAGDIFVTSKGDVYCCGHHSYDSGVDSFVWKNGKVIYTTHEYLSSHSLVVKE